MIYFTSDSHFGHKNIIKFCNRPFQNVIEMNSEMVNAWNSIVKPDDIVYHLGDLIFSMTRKWEIKLLKSLNGQIIVLKGNHDRVKQLDYFINNGLIQEWYYNKQISYEYNNSIYDFSLNHYPHYPLKNDNMICLHGHIHGYFEHRKMTHLRHPRVLDVGVDSVGYIPISIEKVIQIIETNRYQ